LDPDSEGVQGHQIDVTLSCRDQSGLPPGIDAGGEGCGSCSGGATGTTIVAPQRTNGPFGELAAAHKSTWPDHVSMRHATLLAAALNAYRGRVWIDAATIAPPTMNAARTMALSFMRNLLSK
jgi:hypothetical protein